VRSSIEGLLPVAGHTLQAHQRYLDEAAGRLGSGQRPRIGQTAGPRVDCGEGTEETSPGGLKVGANPQPKYPPCGGHRPPRPKWADKWRKELRFEPRVTPAQTRY
jgi:hypothetical protein